MAMQFHHNNPPRKITPPDSFITAPLTPPLTGKKPSEAVVKIHKLLRYRQSGGRVSETPWRTFKLQPDEYDELLCLFKNDESLWGFVENKVRYEQCAEFNLQYAVLTTVADDYILETNGSIRVVVGLDIDYKTKKATISMWRPEYVTDGQGHMELEAAQTMENQIFRDEFGNANVAQDAGLRLELRDFAPENLARGLTDFFLIDSVTLCRFLDEAEKEEQEAKQRQGVVQPLLPGAKKRRREKTPPEELDSEDDQKFEDDERRVRARASNDDSSYKSSGSEEQRIGDPV
ncbi:hypothetical protein B0A49_11799 [Cryomyces minteri]|uniref:Uncharacterized protein n=1 Tax=Cryomyces minteri TaxID=331657 RepID=A0A4U0WF55_9PEZI|nr:hypothetical protein B0A49_11799 [Cryomyces minteri]